MIWFGSMEGSSFMDWIAKFWPLVVWYPVEASVFWLFCVERRLQRSWEKLKTWSRKNCQAVDVKRSFWMGHFCLRGWWRGRGSQVHTSHLTTGHIGRSSRSLVMSVGQFSSSIYIIKGFLSCVTCVTRVEARCKKGNSFDIFCLLFKTHDEGLPTLIQGRQHPHCCCGFTTLLT